VKGQQHPRAKLTDRDVIAMRRMFDEDKLCAKCIGRMFGVSYWVARHVVLRKTWTHVLEVTP